MSDLRESVTFEVTNGLDSEKETVDKIIAMVLDSAIAALHSQPDYIAHVNAKGGYVNLEQSIKAINDIKERQ